MAKSAAGAESYDFKEYDLKEYDLGTADSRLYDYGAYDEYGTGPPAPKAGTYDDEVGPGVAAETETEVTGSSVSTLRPRADIEGAVSAWPGLHSRVRPHLNSSTGWLNAWCLVIGCRRCWLIGCRLIDHYKGECASELF